MTSKLERHRALLCQKEAHMERLRQEIETLSKQVQEEENTEIVATVRSLCLEPEALTQFLRELRQDSEAPFLMSLEEQTKEEDDHEVHAEEAGLPNP